MKLPIFRAVEAAVVAVQAVLVEVLDQSEEGTPFHAEKMCADFPELARAVRILEDSCGRYEDRATLAHAEDVLGDATGLLDCFDPSKYDFEPGDPYALDEVQKARPELATAIETLAASLRKVEATGGWA